VSITVNEMTITVPGNVVKNNDKDGNTLLRFSQDQLQNIVDQAGPVLDFFRQQAGAATSSSSKKSAHPTPEPQPVSGTQEALKEQIDGVKASTPA
jgi:hypothetical protein